MCGIAGLLYDDPQRAAEPALVKAMTDLIAHRGPDADGIHCDGPVGLGHRRLSIIDVSGGDQPIFSADGSVAVIFNGEIYNHKPLRSWLQGRGHRFKTQSDTEVLVYAYLEEGPAFVERLRGMFAFAIWDTRNKRLMLARDRLGQKPLYWSHHGGRLLFGSEIKSFTALGDFDKTIDLQAVSDYLSFLCVMAPRTIFKQVHKLEPGHLLIAEQGRVETRAYWRLDPNETDFRPRRLQQESLLRMVDDAVACRLESEVPLGAFLSGGVDSSTVVALMSRHLKGAVRTASIGFDVAKFDESDYAEQVARRYRTDHYTETVKVDAADEAELRKLVWHFDEPFADPSAIPTGRVSEIARKVVTVALSGDGGDEILGGYRRYQIDLLENRVRGLIPESLRGSLIGALGDAWPDRADLPRPLRLKSALQGLALDAARAHFRSVSYFREPEKYSFFTQGALSALGGYSSFEVLARHYSAVNTRDPLAGLLYVDINTYLPDRMLMKVDKMAMMHSLEVRSPFLDHHLAEQAIRIPAKYKVRSGEGKWILKKIMEPYLPHDVLYRPKQGFDIPLAEWLRGPLAEPLSAALSSLGDRGYLAAAPMTQMCTEHQAGTHDHSSQLWILYMLELWHQVFEA
ncbi:MAG: asparagine synthase (glutamine-hydrolyzing) [Bradymonadia bacterium]